MKDGIFYAKKVIIGCVCLVVTILLFLGGKDLYDTAKYK